MHEKQPQSKPEETTATWQPEAIAERLKTTVEPVQHPAHGEGAAFPIGPEGKLRLETYPETRSARLVGTNAEINLYWLKEEPEISSSGVIFEGLEDGFSLHLVVTPDSGVGVAMASFPGDVPQEPESLLKAPITQSQGTCR